MIYKTLHRIPKIEQHKPHGLLLHGIRNFAMKICYKILNYLLTYWNVILRLG